MINALIGPPGHTCHLSFIIYSQNVGLNLSPQKTFGNVIFRCANISSTYPSKCVRPSVGHTFEFPLDQRLWLLYVKVKVYFSKVYFLKVYFSKLYFPKVYFPKVYFWKVYFPKVYFSKVYPRKSIFRKCIF